MIVACSDCDIHDPRCHVRSISAALDSADTSRLMVTQIVTKRVIVRMMMLLWWFVAPHQDSTCETLNFPCEYKMVLALMTSWCSLRKQMTTQGGVPLQAAEPGKSFVASRSWTHMNTLCWGACKTFAQGMHQGNWSILHAEARRPQKFARFLSFLAYSTFLELHILSGMSPTAVWNCVEAWKIGLMANMLASASRSLQRSKMESTKFHVNNMNYYCTALFCRRAKNGCTDRIFQSGNSGVEIESLSHTCRIYMRKSKIENPLFRQRSWIVQLLGQQWKSELPATQSTHLSLTVV